MNELLAIVLIVLLCCCLFFAWLFALATCPDRMVNLISGKKQSSSPMSRASEDIEVIEGRIDKKNQENANEILANSKQKRPPALLIRSRSIPANRSNGFLANFSAEKRVNSKKLSVVPEADEQLTISSMSQCLRPPNSRHPILENDFVVKTVLLKKIPGTIPTVEENGKVDFATSMEENQNGQTMDKQQQHLAPDSEIEDGLTAQEMLSKRQQRRSAPPSVQII